MYNYSIYESVTRRGYCFVWGESDAKRGSNETATCLHHIKKVDDEKLAKHVILYCDCCSGQNRNRTVIAMIRYFLMNSSHVEKVDVKFLLPGHTYMPADSIHSTIEHFIRRRMIWAPSEWPTVIRLARCDPEPYNVISMTHDKFNDWSIVQKAVVPNILRDSNNELLKWRQVRAVSMDKSLSDIKVRYSLQDGKR